jgi:hypothetical protein
MSLATWIECSAITALPLSSETRAEELFDVVEGHHPDLGMVIVIRTQIDAVLLCEKDLEDPRTLARSA